MNEVSAANYQAMAESEREYRLRTMKAEAQRDELLAAAKLVENSEPFTYQRADALKALREAIRKVESQ
jgi:hypothetical protein